MNVKHYTVGVGMWIDTKYRRTRSKIRRKYRKMKIAADEKKVEEKAINSVYYLTTVAQAVSAILFLTSVVAKMKRTKSEASSNKDNGEYNENDQ